jgi:hypothetical protein
MEECLAPFAYRLLVIAEWSPCVFPLLCPRLLLRLHVWYNSGSHLVLQDPSHEHSEQAASEEALRQLLQVGSVCQITRLPISPFKGRCWR